MTEADWMECNDPRKLMVTVMRKCRKPSKRKGVLLAIACCRLVWHLLNDYRFRSAVEVTEACLLGVSNVEDQTEAFGAAYAAFNSLKADRFDWPATDDAGGLAARLSLNIAGSQMRKDHVVMEATWDIIPHTDNLVVCRLLRDLFGNPFRPIVIRLPIFLTPTVIELAQTIYDDPAFDCLPLLADALEEAGCTDAAIIDHCRGPGPHVRGCWVVDLLLGKT